MSCFITYPSFGDPVWLLNQYFPFTPCFATIPYLHARNHWMIIKPAELMADWKLIVQ